MSPSPPPPPQHTHTIVELATALFLSLTFQILMNVLTETTIAITTLHARMMMVHFIAFVMLGLQDMGLIAKVSSE